MQSVTQGEPLIPSLKLGWEKLNKKSKDVLVKDLVAQIKQMDEANQKLNDKNNDLIAKINNWMVEEKKLDIEAAMAKDVLCSAYNGGIQLKIKEAYEDVKSIMKPLYDYRDSLKME